MRTFDLVTTARQQNGAKPSYVKKPGHSCPFCAGQSFTAEAELKRHLNHQHFHDMNKVFFANPSDFYKRVFGPFYKSENQNQLRYHGGLVICLSGSGKGLWYSFTRSIGGGPLQALEFASKLKSSRASESLKLADIFMQMKDHHSFHLKDLLTSPGENYLSRENVVAEEKRRVQTAQSIWNSTKRLQGSLAEEYLVRYRRIPQHTISRLCFKYLPAGAQYLRNGETPHRFACAALVVPVYDCENQLKATQRVMLDKFGRKLSNNGKISNGLVKENAGLVQRGLAHHPLYVCEGPETGASIASVMPESVTVLATLSLANLHGTAKVIMSYKPSNVVIAGDRDANLFTHEAFLRSVDTLRKKLSHLGMSAVEVKLPDASGSDWNDVLRETGVQNLWNLLIY